MLVKFIKVHSLDDAPWTWKYSWNKDMPEFFQVARVLGVRPNSARMHARARQTQANSHPAANQPLLAGYARARLGGRVRQHL